MSDTDGREELNAQWLLDYRARKRKFITTLDEHIQECALKTAGYAQRRTRASSILAAHWQIRKQTLMEIRKLWTETIGG